MTPAQVFIRPPDAAMQAALGQQPHAAAIDVALAQAQHHLLADALAAAGCTVNELPAAAGHPDACFVQDVALLLPDLAILAWPAEPSRQAEVALFRPHLPAHLPVAAIQAPGTLEWGDVLRLDDTFYVGLSARSNAAGAAQLAALLQPLGLRVATLPVLRGLHLLTGVNSLGRGPQGNDERTVVLAWPDYADLPELAGCDLILVPPEEAPAANCLALGDTVLVPAGYPRTAAQIWQRGYRVLAVPLSEFAKADGGVTCLCVMMA
ncbi:MAG: N(G),N(G)-dimethylarginine dimethylaminohydrolase [Caldilineales bacterium]